MAIWKQIGQEQNLTDGALVWIVCIAQAIVSASKMDVGKNMSEIAKTAGISRTTLYQKMRQVVEMLNWMYTTKKSITTLLGSQGYYRQQWWETQLLLDQSKQTIQDSWVRLGQYHEQLQQQNTQISQLQRQQHVNLERLVLVLHLTGRCSIGSVVSILQEALGVKVSAGYIHSVLKQSRSKAGGMMALLVSVLPLSGAIAIDEVFLREWGKRIYGVVVVDPITGLIVRLQRVEQRSQSALANVIKPLIQTRLKESVKLCLTDMYASYESLVATYFPAALHQYCWFHINCFHLGATVRQAKSSYQRAQKALTTFQRKSPRRRKTTKRRQEQLTQTLEQERRFYLCTQRFQRLLLSILEENNINRAVARLERLIRIGQKSNNPYIKEMAVFVKRHQPGLLNFIKFRTEQSLKRPCSIAGHNLVLTLSGSAVPKTTNAAEHIFRCLRRYLHGMDHAGTSETTQGFFDLFAFFHNVRILRAGSKAGTSLLAAAGVDVVKVFGSDDPYTILGFPPPFEKVVSLRTYKKLSSPSHAQRTA